MPESATGTPTPAEPPLHLIWLLDVSASADDDGKLSSAKYAVGEFTDGLRRVRGNLTGGADLSGVYDRAGWYGRPGPADPRGNPPGGLPRDLNISVLTFAAEVRWAADQIPADRFAWSPEWAGHPDRSGTALGSALRALAARLEAPPAPVVGRAPVLALLSDGQPTDDWADGLRALDAAAWGRSAVRVAIKLGEDAQASVLEAFADDRSVCEPADTRYVLLGALYQASAIRAAGAVAGIEPGARRRPAPVELAPADPAAKVAW